MTQQTKAQKETVERVMHEFKHGELKIRGDGPKVENSKQAIAIALHEAGATNQESPARNQANLRRTKVKESRGETAQDETEGRRSNRRSTEPTKASLYAEAKRQGIPGRSGMSKDQLRGALHA